LTIAPTTASPPEAGDSEVVHPPAAPAGPGRGVASVVLVAAVVVLLLTVAWLNRWVADDGFINLRVVANMHDGFGPVFNVGERVEVFTSPLWIAALWLFSSILPGVALEWIAVVAGALAAALGFVAAARGAWLLWGGTGRRGLAVPLGLLVVVAVRPVWDFATSGLETGLTFAWLGCCFWALAVLHYAQPRRWSATATAVLIGLGPLVRPDLAIFSVGFLVLLLVLPPAPKRLARLRLLLWAALVPVAYELFRMGYYAALEPNTALAKEAGQADWGRGWDYLKDFVRPYYLFIPVIALLGAVAYELRDTMRARRNVLLFVAVPIACAGLHALYIVRVGGDFMHGRMFLPSLFGAMLPVAVVVTERRRLLIAAGVIVSAWAIVAIAALRPSYGDPRQPHIVGDERAFYAAVSGSDHPVTLHDYRATPYARNGWALRALAHHGRALVVQVPWTPLRVVNGQPGSASAAPVVGGAHAIGVIGYAAGPKVHIADQLALADPIASHFRIEGLTLPGGIQRPARSKPGHEKYMAAEWIAARFGPPGAKRLPGIRLSPAWLAAAQRSLACPSIRKLVAAVHSPMTFDRFFSNMRQSFSLDRLRFSADPVRAERQLCSPD
jgi:arabinofuranosyltransferase